MLFICLLEMLYDTVICIVFVILCICIFLIFIESAFGCNILHLWVRLCKQWRIVHVIDQLYATIVLWYWALAFYPYT